MSKERLEEMKHKVIGLTDYKGYFIDEVTMKVDVYAWFYEQAERVQELEKANKTLSDNHFQQIEQHKYLVQQNKRYREAIVRAKTLLANIGDDTSSKMSAISILSKPLEGEK